MEEIDKKFQNNPAPNDIVQYIVYTTDSSTGECIYDYVGSDYNEADAVFNLQVNHLKFTSAINKNASVVLKDCYNEKTIKTFSNDTN